MQSDSKTMHAVVHVGAKHIKKKTGSAKRANMPEDQCNTHHFMTSLKRMKLCKSRQEKMPFVLCVSHMFTIMTNCFTQTSLQ